jgi:hypothetical protein
MHVKKVWFWKNGLDYIPSPGYGGTIKAYCLCFVYLPAWNFKDYY